MAEEKAQSEVKQEVNTSGAENTEEKKEEEEEKKPRSVFKLFLGSLSVMAIFIVASIIMLITESEGKIISALVYTTAMLIFIYLLVILPIMDSDPDEKKRARENMTKKKRRISILGSALKLVLFVCVISLGYIGIYFSNLFGDMIAIAILFAGMIAYFVAFANID